MPLKVVPRRDRKLNRLVKSAEPRAVRKGRTVFRRGEEADLVYLILEGHVRLTFRRRNGVGDRTVAVAGPWELLGEEALTPESKRRYTAVAGEECVLLPLLGRRVQKALRGSPKTLSVFVEAMAEDHAHLRRLAGASARARIADVILDLSRRLGEDEGRRIRIPHWFTHQELADLSNVHRSTVTTTLNEWIYEGVLKEGQKSLIVAKIGALRKAGSEPSRSRPRS